MKLENKNLNAEKKTLATENKSLSSENKKLSTDNAKLSSDSKTMTAENKTLSAKLAANRTVAASVESANTKIASSAVKANGGIRLMGSAEAAQTAQAAQLKEDIYSDLTGLIIRGVKRETEEDVFDCIQTGRNGSKSCESPSSILRTDIRPSPSFQIGSSQRKDSRQLRRCTVQLYSPT